MTREEAILWLNEELRTWENECQSKHPIKEALYEACKALERELNTWSLDDAREDFMHDVYNILDFLPTNDEANRIIDSFDMVTKGIKQEPRWIPVTERLPENGGDYLVTLSLYVGGKEPAREIRKDFYCILSKKWLYNNDDVTAWMPSPQPYRAGGEDKE